MDVILVNYNNEVTGISEKLEAHKQGFLHRAFSIFLVNKKGELLLQKRQVTKYHCGGLWTNTCCSHQRPNMKEEDSIHQQLNYEMGITCDLKPMFDFYYYVTFDNGLIEHEYDIIYWGYYDANPRINTEEVSDFKWLNIELIKHEIALHPEQYTYWFRSIFLPFCEFIKLYKQ